ncbi:MAG: hypothetical protein RJB68_2156 [Pseudomonadota bacterium]|jgi:hypothetical protein
MTLWKQRLFFRLQRPDDGDGSDLGGEVISINGQGTDAPADDAPGTPEDRGDFLPDDTKPDADPPADNVDTDPEADTGRRTSGIPKARFDEVNEKRKAAEAELEQTRAELAAFKAGKPAPTAPAAPTTPAPAADSFNEDEQERAYLDAMLDGDSDKALQIRKQINAHLRAQAANDIEVRNTEKQAADALMEAATQAVIDYPYLDTLDGEFARGLIMTTRDQAIAQGKSPAQALTDAVAKIAPRFAPEGSTTPTPVLPKGKGAVDTRTQQALERGAADSLRQPASAQAGIGNRADAVRTNVMQMDENQFANLSAEEKRRLRGD